MISFWVLIYFGLFTGKLINIKPMNIFLSPWASSLWVRKDWILSFHIFKFHFPSKISPDICGSPAMIIRPYNVQVKWVKWSIYNLQYFQQSRLHFRLKTLLMDCRQSIHQSEYKKKRPPKEVLLLGVYFQICTTKSKGAEVICHNLHIHGKIMNIFCLKKRHFKIVPFS